MRVFVSVGHDSKRVGAKSPFTNEYEYDICIEFTQYLYEELIELDIDVEKVWSDNLSDAISEINGKKRIGDIAVEAHFNSFADPAVKGCETLYYKGSKRGEELAGDIQNSMLAHLRVYNRGLLPRDNLAFLKKVKCVSIIIEPFFLSNKEEVARFLLKDREANLRNIAYSVSLGVKSFINRNK